MTDRIGNDDIEGNKMTEKSKRSHIGILLKQYNQMRCKLETYELKQKLYESIYEKNETCVSKLHDNICESLQEFQNNMEVLISNESAKLIQRLITLQNRTSDAHLKLTRLKEPYKNIVKKSSRISKSLVKQTKKLSNRAKIEEKVKNGAENSDLIKVLTLMSKKNLDDENIKQESDERDSLIIRLPLLKANVLRENITEEKISQNQTEHNAENQDTTYVTKYVIDEAQDQTDINDDDDNGNDNYHHEWETDEFESLSNKNQWVNLETQNKEKAINNYTDITNKGVNSDHKKHREISNTSITEKAQLPLESCLGSSEELTDYAEDETVYENPIF